MSYIIVAVIFFVIGFGGCFLVYRNNMCKIAEIDEIISKGKLDVDTLKKIEEVIKGECKKNDCGC